MSADNGIYVGRFLNDGGKYEYRVTHAQAIENCEYSSEFPKEFTEANQTVYFAHARPYAYLEDALKEAHRLLKDTVVCEYGIVNINYDVVLDLDVEAAGKIIEDFWKKSPIEQDCIAAFERGEFTLLSERIEELKKQIDPEEAFRRRLKIESPIRVGFIVLDKKSGKMLKVWDYQMKPFTEEVIGVWLEDGLYYVPRLFSEVEFNFSTIAWIGPYAPKRV